MRATAMAVLACGLLSVLSVARADTIVESASFHTAIHGAYFTGYAQLPPALVPLDGVEFSSSATGLSDSYVLRNTSLAPVIFNVHTSDAFGTDAGSASFSSTVAFMLSAQGSMNFQYAINGGNPINSDAVITSGLGTYVGTGYLSPSVFFSETVTTNNSAITVALAPGNLGLPEPSYTGTEQVTYYYGVGDPPPSVPEPTSLVILAAGLLGVAGLARARARHRRVAARGLTPAFRN
jgi:hypothetical protein